MPNHRLPALPHTCLWPLANHLICDSQSHLINIKVWIMISCQGQTECKSLYPAVLFALCMFTSPSVNVKMLWTHLGAHLILTAGLIHSGHLQDMRKEGLQRLQPLMDCSRCFHQASCPASAGCWITSSNGIMTEHQPTSQHHTRIVTLHCINNAIYYHLITNIINLITESLTHIMLHLYNSPIFIQ